MVITMMPVRAYGADTPQPITSGISQTEVQSESQSKNQDANQTENQSSNRSTDQSENQGVNQNAGHNELQSKGQSKMQSLNQSAGGSGINETFTVEFRVNGNLFPGETQQIKAGNLVSKPNINTGYYLLGWYRDEKCEYKWDFAEDKVYSDLTLYARSMSIIDVNDEEDLRNKLIGYSESYIIRLAKDITIQDKDKKIQDSGKWEWY